MKLSTKEMFATCLIVAMGLLGFLIGRATATPDAKEPDILPTNTTVISPIKTTDTTTETLPSTISKPTNESSSKGIFKLTAYCPCMQCCGKTNGITASGVKATAGRTVAADTSIFPFGTKLLIDGKEYIVEDRGGSIKGNRIDIYFDTHEEALQFGVQHKEVLALE